MRLEINSEFARQFNFLDIEDLEDQYLFVPYSSINRWIPGDDVWLKMHESFPLQRLHQIKQLSLLSYTGDDVARVTTLPFVHTRYQHSQQVAIMGAEVKKLNGATYDEQNRTKIKFALHDIATVALGDTTKLLDRAGLDEESHWKDVVGEDGDRFLKSYGLSDEEVSMCLSNTDLDGKLLDIVDRICYTMLDSYYIFGLKPNSKDPYMNDARDIILNNPKIGDIYKDIGIDRRNERIVFGNEDNLGDFLELRALLHKYLYMHPDSVGRDMYAAELLKPLYQSKDTINPKKLREMTDYDLMSLLKDYYKSDYLDTFRFVNFHPNYEKFGTQQEAEYAMDRMQKSGIVTLGISYRKFNPAIHYFVNHNREILPFKEVNYRADSIKKIADSVNGYFVYSIPEDEDKAANLLSTARRQLSI